MANPIDDLHAVFAMCGIPNAATQTLIMNHEGFNQLDNLGVLETNMDITEMAKRMASHTQAEGRVLLGTVIIKRLQTLVWWIRDHQKHGWPLTQTNLPLKPWQARPK
jgi:3-methyladenine DNA glycosylase Tag